MCPTTISYPVTPLILIQNFELQKSYIAPKKAEKCTLKILQEIEYITFDFCVTKFNSLFCSKCIDSQNCVRFLHSLHIRSGESC